MKFLKILLVILFFLLLFTLYKGLIDTEKLSCENRANAKVYSETRLYNYTCQVKIDDKWYPVEDVPDLTPGGIH